MKRFFVGAVAVATCAYAYACDSSPQSHVYVASLYDGVSCFAASSSLGYVNTPDGNLDCAPTCLATTTATGQSLIYVSTMCGPYPPGYDTTQTNASCAGAIQAWASAGGPSACATTPDAGGGDDGAAGGDSAAGEDSAVDGPTSDDAGDVGSSPADAAEGG